MQIISNAIHISRITIIISYFEQFFQDELFQLKK
jgi:hypothetical protein